MSVWLTGWSVDLLRRRERNRPELFDAPVVFVETREQRRVIVRCCDACLNAGVRPGMSLAQARAVVPDRPPLRAIAYRGECEAESLRRLAVWAQWLSPVVAPDEPDGLLLDISGCAPLFGGESELLREIKDCLLGLGFRARVGIASTFGCAWAAARFVGGETIVASGRERETMSGLPTSALRIEHTVVSALAQVGIERIGDLLRLPRASLPARFGGDLLLRLDQALGEAIETVAPVRAVAPPASELAFSGPTTSIEGVEAATRDLLSQLSAALLRRECGVLRLRCSYLRSDLPATGFDLTLSRPTRDAQRLWRLAQPRIERLNMGYGIEGVRLAACSVAPLRHEQLRTNEDISGESGRPRALAELVDSLINRLGDDRVLRAELRESHDPKRSSALLPAAHGRPRRAERFSPCDRPLVLFRQPEPIDVLAVTPDGPVHRVRWRGGEHIVRACYGPERIAPEWWRASAGDLEFFTLLTARGEWLWAARETPGGAWCMHGAWA